MINLPEEIIVHIFDFLKFKDLSSVTETCHKFNEIVSKNSKLLDNFRLKLKSDIQSIDYDNCRRYSKMRLWITESTKNMLTINENVIDLKIGEKGRRLSVAHIINLMHLYNILSFFPNLQILTCERLFTDIFNDDDVNEDEFNEDEYDENDFDEDFDDNSNSIFNDRFNENLDEDNDEYDFDEGFDQYFNESQNDVFKLPPLELKLDSLTFWYDEEILKFLSACQSKHLKIFVRDYKIRQIANLKSFLKSQKSLENLEIRTVENFYNNLKLFNDESLLDAEFKLRKFRVDFDEFKSSTRKNFKKFMQNQKSLSELIVFFGSGNFNDNSLDAVDALSEIQHLKTLTLPRISFDIAPLPHIEKLTLQKFVSKNPKTFNKKFPNVTNLTIKNCSNLKFVKKIPSKARRKISVSYLRIPRVKTLKLHRVSFVDSQPFADGKVDFENLTIINCCIDDDWMMRFLSENGAKLKCLTLKNIRLGDFCVDYLRV